MITTISRIPWNFFLHSTIILLLTSIIVLLVEIDHSICEQHQSIKDSVVSLNTLDRGQANEWKLAPHMYWFVEELRSHNPYLKMPDLKASPFLKECEEPIVYDRNNGRDREFEEGFRH